MTSHEFTIRQFLADRPSWQRRELRKHLNKMFEGEPVHSLGFIPDAFEIDKEAETVRLLEVEGSSRTDKLKLFKICQLWYLLDSLSWHCTLTTVHLVTGAIGEVTDEMLARHWSDFCQEQRSATAPVF